MLLVVHRATRLETLSVVCIFCFNTTYDATYKSGPYFPLIPIMIINYDLCIMSGHKKLVIYYNYCVVSNCCFSKVNLFVINCQQYP